MRPFLIALALMLAAAGADASAFKAHYGHYYATRYTDNTGSDVAALCGKVGLKGINYRVRWGDVETSDGTYNDATFNAVLATIAGLGAPSGGKPNNTCKVWLFPETKLFSGGPTIANGDVQPCPTWLTDSTGALGYAANTDTTGSVTIAGGAASVTNASPIHVVTSAAHGLTSGDAVFIDLVAGNTAANGRWIVTKVSNTEITLNGSHGNGARTGTTGKVATGTLIYTCKMWDATVKTKFQAFMKHLGDTYDGNANVEGFILEESALGLNGAFAQDSTVGGTYTGVAWTNNIVSHMQYCAATAFPTSRCMAFLNQIAGNQAGLHTVSDAIHAIAGNQACYSGPDLLPNSTGLYNGVNQTYQVLVRHAGCRSNSAQNNSFSVPGYSMTDIFNFAVQGSFGTFPCGTAATGSCTPKTAVTKNDGLCVNSYIFWNDSASEQTAADPVIQANPYGSQWYGQCSCGGSEP